MSRIVFSSGFNLMGVYMQMMLRVHLVVPQVLPELAQKVGAARVFCSGGGSAGAASLAVERRVATALKVHKQIGWVRD